MKHMKKIAIVLTRDEDELEIFNVSVPSLPGCLTWGHGKREALKNAREVIALFLESMEDHGEEVMESEAVEVEVAA